MHVFLNARAGSVSAPAPELAAAVTQEFARHGTAARVHLLQPADLLRAVESLIAGTPECIVVGGGDGTLSSVAGLLAHSTTALGILPLGTLNHFATDLGVPTDWRAAVAAICRGRRQRVDLAEVNGRSFLNTCSIGSYVDALRRREFLRRHAGHGKWRAMFWACVAVLRRVPRLRVTVVSEERTTALRASFVLFSNNRYQEDVIISGRRTAVMGGRVCVYASRAHRYRDLFHTIWVAWRHGISRTTQLDIWESRAVELQCAEPRLPVAIDGEIHELALPLRIRSLPGALHVLGPALE